MKPSLETIDYQLVKFIHQTSIVKNFLPKLKPNQQGKEEHKKTHIAWLVMELVMSKNVDV